MNRRKALRNIALGGTGIIPWSAEVDVDPYLEIEEIELSSAFAAGINEEEGKKAISDKNVFYLKSRPSVLMEKELDVILSLLFSQYYGDVDYANLEAYQEAKKHLEGSNLRQILKGIDKFFPKRAMV